MPGRNLFAEEAPKGRNLFAPATADQLRAKDPAEYDPNSDAYQAKYGSEDAGINPMNVGPFMRRVKGKGEALLNLSTGMVGGLAGGLTYLGTLAGSGGNTGAAKAVQEATQAKITYPPKTAEGKRFATETAEKLSWLGPKEGAWAGEKAADLTGSPALGAAVNTGINALPMMAGVRGPKSAGTLKVAPEVVPTLGELKGASTAAYTAAKNSGELAPQTALHPLIKDVESYLTEKGYHPEENPSAARQLSRLYDEATRPDVDLTSMTGIDSVRKGLVNSENSAFSRSQPGKTSPDAMMASEIVDKFDDWIDTNFPKAGGKWQEARDLWRRYRNSQTIQDLFDRAEIRAGQYSNAGPENALRIEFSRLSTNQRRMRYFSDAEKQAIRDVAETKDTQLAIRQVGKLFSPHSVGGALLSGVVGGTLGLPLGLAAAGVGASSKLVAGRMRLNAANRVRNQVALGKVPGVPAPPARAVNPLGALPYSAGQQQ